MQTRQVPVATYDKGFIALAACGGLIHVMFFRWRGLACITDGMVLRLQPGFVLVFALAA